MELKVVCDCGQKYKFDVEPVNGKMPFTLNCPVCQVDGTSKANELLAAQFALLPNLALTSGLAAVSPAGSSVPESAHIISAPPAIAPVTGGLRINRAAHPEPVPAAAAGDPTPLATGRLRPFAVAAALNPPKKSSFGMGLLGGLLGALVGALVYFLIFKYTGLRLKLLALGVGALAGWFADFLGKGEGSKELGGITAVLVATCVVGAQYLVTLGWWHEATAGRWAEAQSAYANAVIEAKGAVKAVPTGSDAEIRAYLAKQGNDEGVKLGPADIAADDVKGFHDIQLPQYQALASGQLTKEQYEQAHKIKTSPTKEEQDSDEGTFKAVFLLLFATKANIFSLIAAAALAFKLSTNV